VKTLLKQHLDEHTEFFESEHRFKNRDGSWSWILARGKVVEQTADAQPLRIVGTHIDISERKEAEEKERLSAKVFETVAEGIMVCNADNRIIAVNKTFTRITGYSNEEIIGNDPGLLSSGRHDECFYKTMWQHLMEDGVWEGEVWNRRKNGEVYPEWLSIATVKDDDGVLEQYIAVFSDITKRKESEDVIRYQANHDALTELPNRHLLMEHLGYELHRAYREKKLVALMFIDLDRFKPVNDTFGHAVGDKLLCEVAQRITHCLRESDMVARLGGDEFTVVLPDLSSLDEVEGKAGKLLHELAQPFYLEGRELFISASIGVTIYPDDASDLPTLMTNADNAMYRAKSAGRNTYRFFTPEMNVHALERLGLESDLHRALQRGELVPYYQPILEIGTGRVIGAEALLRWEHPEHGMIPPSKFIPLAEATGLITPIGEWLLGTVCRQAGLWQQQGCDIQRVSVNISSRQFRSDLLRTVQNVLKTNKLEPECLELEIVENLLLEDIPENTNTLNELSKMGVRLAIDDFGTGYSSLNYLKRFSFNVLKIDRSFVADLPDDRDDANLVKTIITMAHGFNLEVVAEGVESENQLKFLDSQSCDFAQGFYFCRPVPAELFEKYLSETQNNS